MTPFEKWGPDTSKMRSRAIEDYLNDYPTAVKKWPEFKAEYDQMTLDQKEIFLKALKKATK